MHSKRIQNIVSVLPKCNILADVGCDHGYVGIEALVQDKANNVVFCDISDCSLQKAKQNCPQNLLKRASFICADGIPQTCQCDCAVIAGMGGLEIISILSHTIYLPRFLVLQPMKNAFELRKFLVSNYIIETDSLFFDGNKYYNLISATMGNTSPMTELQLFFGKDNLTKPSKDFVKYLLNEKIKLTKILSSCNDIDVQKRLNLVQQAIAKIQEVQS